MDATQFTPRQIKRFWSKILVSDLLSCWEWQGKIHRDGYGIFYTNGKDRRINRVSLCLSIGYLPDKVHALHTCDNPICGNPAHLFEGNDADNVADMRAKGRHAHGDTSAPRLHPESMFRGYGEALPFAKLTEAKVREMRLEHAEGNISFQALSRKYKIDARHISRIIKREAWPHVE